MGGDCLNVGCVPSKALIRAARALADVRGAAAFGVRLTGEATVDFAAVMERMRRIRAGLSPIDSAARFRGLGVDVFLGAGAFTGRDTVAVGGATLRFKKAVIATGARAAAPAIPGLAETGYLTNETVFSLTALPRRLAVIGGGPIGCELAQAFARFGAQVTLLRGERAAPGPRGPGRRQARERRAGAGRRAPHARRNRPPGRPGRGRPHAARGHRRQRRDHRGGRDPGGCGTQAQCRGPGARGGGRGVRRHRGRAGGRSAAHEQFAHLRRGRRVHGAEVHPPLGLPGAPRHPERALPRTRPRQRSDSPALHLYRSRGGLGGDGRARGRWSAGSSSRPSPSPWRKSIAPCSTARPRAS